MQVLLLYESCTGNTAYGVEVIRRVLVKDGHSCTVERFRDAGASEVHGFDLYGFATPLNSFAPLAPVWSWLKALPQLPGKPAFIFTTGNGYAGVAHRLMARRLRKHGLVVLGHHLMKSADSCPWPSTRCTAALSWPRASGYSTRTPARSAVAVPRSAPPGPSVCNQDRPSPKPVWAAGLASTLARRMPCAWGLSWPGPPRSTTACPRVRRSAF
jgi:hypothetical protein